MRVNARLDEQSESDLKFLQQVTHTTSTDINSSCSDSVPGA